MIKLKMKGMKEMINSSKRMLLLAVMATILIIIAAGCSSASQETSKDINTGLAANTISNEAFKDIFPLHYESYRMNDTGGSDHSFFGGSDDYSKIRGDIEPALPILFSGYGFAKEYNEERGHTYAIEDNVNIDRTGPNSIGSCYTCKSTAVPILLSEEEMGEDYWATNFDDVVARGEELGHSPIGCSDCHDPATMELRITRPSFTRAMELRGEDLSKATKNDMRTYVCAQCHVEYYFESEKKAVTFPWTNGVEAEEIYEYYEDVPNGGPFTDWTHAVSGTPMLKAQHPEYETWSNGTHGQAGVTCSDCHMPYQRVDGKKKISSHWWTSPLRNIEDSCLTCHGDKTETQMKDRVYNIQSNHNEKMLQAEDLAATAHFYVNRMITLGAPEAKIKEAQEHIRKGQWFGDFVAAENSYGFHNPQGSMDNLATAIDESHKVINIASIELTKLGADLDELDEQIAMVKAELKILEKEDFIGDATKVDTLFGDIFPNVTK